MATLEESASQPGGNDKAGPLIAAIELISGDQQYTFNLYQRLVLPIDGFVFWVKASEISPQFLSKYLGDYNSSRFNTANFNGSIQVPPSLTPAQQLIFQFSVNGSLHVSQELNQEEDQTYASQRLAFTTKDEVQNFVKIAPDQLYITTIPNGSRIAFGSQDNHYQLAGLWHYHGRALYSSQFTQVVDDPRTLHTSLEIVSNSLPFWLQLSTAQVPIYPSFLTPLNSIPPFITADIYETVALQQTPDYGLTLTQNQLVTDDIRFTMYGLNNDAALDFQMKVLNTSLDGNYGIMNMPVPKDLKLPQVEFTIIAQKKSMDLKVNYYQTRARDVARQYILHAFINLTPVPASFPTPIVV